MSNLFKGVRCLTQEQYEELKTNGTIIIDGETYLFEEDWLYVTPEDVSGIARNNKKRLDSLTNEFENTKLIIAENKNNITLLKSNYTTISNDLNDVKTDVNDLIATSVTLDGVQTITGPKTFTENIYLANTDGTVDRISHINNNFIIYSGAENGVALLNIDEGLDKIYAFNKELAFKEDLTDSSGSKVYVSGELKESVSFDEDPQTQITQNTNYINDSKKSIEFAESEMQKSKNLFKSTLKAVSTSTSGITSTEDSNGRITTSGSSSLVPLNSLYLRGIGIPVELQSGQSYYISIQNTFNVVGLDIKINFYFYKKSDATQLDQIELSLSGGDTGISYTPTEDCYLYWVVINVPSGTQVNCSYSIQIEKGEKTAFQPYNGAIVHSNDKSLTFAENERQKSKNLIRLVQYERLNNLGVSATVNLENQTITFTGTSTAVNEADYGRFVPVTLKAGKTYSYGLFDENGNVANSYAYNIDGIQLFNTETGYWTNLFHANTTITFTEDTRFDAIRIYISSAYVGREINATFKFQVAEEDTITSWQYPYGAIVHKKDIADVEHVKIIYDNISQPTPLGTETAYSSGLEVAQGNGYRYYIPFSDYDRLEIVARASNQNQIHAFLDLTNNYNVVSSYSGRVCVIIDGGNAIEFVYTVPTTKDSIYLACIGSTLNVVTIRGVKYGNSN